MGDRLVMEEALGSRGKWDVPNRSDVPGHFLKVGGVDMPLRDLVVSCTLAFYGPFWDSSTSFIIQCC